MRPERRTSLLPSGTLGEVLEKDQMSKEAQRQLEFQWSTAMSCSVSRHAAVANACVFYQPSHVHVTHAPGRCLGFPPAGVALLPEQ